jgi:hypothetical protein
MMILVMMEMVMAVTVMVLMVNADDHAGQIDDDNGDDGDG